MDIVVIGTGYVGLVSGACFSEMGINVTCVDVDIEKINAIKDGNMPIYEPGLSDMVLRNMKMGRLHFTSSLGEAMRDADIIFIAVGTPSDEDGYADLRYVEQVAHEIGESIDHYVLVVTKSTVPVGTTFKVKEIISQEISRRGVEVDFEVASNPEFLKEGAAINDFMSPDRVVVGVESQRGKDLMSQLYRPFLINNFRVIFMDILSSEMTKYAANAMLATRISFMNEIASLCEVTGADVNSVRKGISTDTRIGGKFLYPGCGYGGSCFPKDVKALIRTAGDYGYRMKIIEAVEDVNNIQKRVVFRKLQESLGDLSDKCVAIWGLSFKPETDDIREATSIVTINLLLQAGASVRVYDPVAMEAVRRVYGDRLYYAEDMYDVLEGVDAMALVTEWKQFRVPDLDKVKRAMKGDIVVDGRNILDPQELLKQGFKYMCVGRKL